MNNLIHNGNNMGATYVFISGRKDKENMVCICSMAYTCMVTPWLLFIYGNKGWIDNFHTEKQARLAQ
jgi:hypothetical protein